MMRIFDNIDKHPFASIVALVFVVGLGLLIYECWNAPMIDDEDEFYL